jgi:hypothetical protein
MVKRVRSQQMAKMLLAENDNVPRHSRRIALLMF